MLCVSLSGYAEHRKSDKAPTEKGVKAKKRKAHFVGVRRPPEVKSASSTPKKSKRVKNAWFSSKTQPKTPKKAVVVEEEQVELPEDRPHLDTVQQ